MDDFFNILLPQRAASDMRRWRFIARSQVRRKTKVALKERKFDYFDAVAVRLHAAVRHKSSAVQ